MNLWEVPDSRRAARLGSKTGHYKKGVRKDDYGTSEGDLESDADAFRRIEILGTLTGCDNHRDAPEDLQGNSGYGPGRFDQWWAVGQQRIELVGCDSEVPAGCHDEEAELVGRQG